MRLVSALFVIAGILACDDTGSYLYLARAYDDSTSCLGDVQSLDVLSGKDPGLGCAPRCLIAAPDDSGVITAYGTTACGPWPVQFNASETDPRCAAIKAAVTRSDVCLADGGQSAPADSGLDATVATDAADQ